MDRQPTPLRAPQGWGRLPLAVLSTPLPAPVSKIFRRLAQLSVRPGTAGRPCLEQSWTVRTLRNPEDDSASWFLVGRDVHVVEDGVGLDPLLANLGTSRGSLYFDPPELRPAFEREFGPCAAQRTVGTTSEVSLIDSPPGLSGS